MVRFSVGDIPRYPDYADADYILEERRRLIEERGGAPDGFFDASDQALYLSFARMSTFSLGFGWLYRPLVLRVPYGVNAKVLYSDLDSQNAQGSRRGHGHSSDYSALRHSRLALPGLS